MDASPEKTTDLGKEAAAETPFRWPDLDDPKIGRRRTGSIMELAGKHKDDPLFDEVWDQILRDREAQTELAEREAMEWFMSPFRQQYLLDADILRLWLKGNINVFLRAQQTPKDCIWISAITVQETLRGWLNRIEQERPSPSDRICRLYDDLLQAVDDVRMFNVLSYTPRAHQVFNAMSASAKRVGTNDRRIAASAIAHDFVVATRNTRHFEQIGGVRYED